MATHGQDATKPSSDFGPAVLVYDPPSQDASESDIREFISKLKEALKADTPILVRNWSPQLPCQKMSFESAVYLHFGQKESTVEWICKSSSRLPTS